MYRPRRVRRPRWPGHEPIPGAIRDARESQRFLPHCYTPRYQDTPQKSDARLIPETKFLKIDPILAT